MVEDGDGLYLLINYEFMQPSSPAAKSQKPAANCLLLQILLFQSLYHLVNNRAEFPI